MSIAEQLADELGEPEPKSNPKASKRGASSFSVFDAANGISTIQVLDSLGVSHNDTNRGEMAECPGCGEDGALVCGDGGLKCLHDRCSQAGPRGKPGFRTNVDIVALVQKLAPLDAARWLCERFGIDVPKARSNGAPPDDWTPTDDDAPDAPPPSGEGRGEPSREQPTQADPLRGLKHLSAVAVLGKDAILTLAREPIEYAWDDIAVMATVVLIAGPPSGGKTTLLFLLLAARLSPAPINLLGRDVHPSNPKQYMVLIEGEHSEPSAARKLVRSLELLDVSTDGLERVIIVARKAVRLGSPEWVDVERMVQQGLVSDIAIDTVARVAPADGSSEQEQVAIFDAVARTIEFGPEDRKPLVWAVAHIRKNGQTGDVEDVSGSTQRTGQADSVLLIKPEKEGGRTISTTVTFVKLREDPEDRWPEPAQFSIVTEGERRVLKQDCAAESVDTRPLEERILEKLAAGKKTANALSKDLKRSYEAVQTAITNLFEARRIRSTSVKVRGKETKAFELAPEWRQDP